MKNIYIIDRVISVHNDEVSILIYGGGILHIHISGIKSWHYIGDGNISHSFDIERGQAFSCEIVNNIAFDFEFIPERFIWDEGEEPNRISSNIKSYKQ